MRIQQWGRLAVLVLIAALTAVCSDGSTSLVQPTEPSFAKGGSGKSGGGGGGSDPTVDTVEPAHGRQGETLDVAVYGSGFDDTSQATWELDGAPATGVHTLRTDYVSSSELAVRISIDDDATVELYDVAVTAQSGRKKGIGLERFEVTEAIPLATLGGNSKAHAVNDAGQAAGFSGSRAAYWDGPAADDLVDLGDGQAWDMDDAASVIVGIADRPVTWTGAGKAWTGPHPLPLSGGATAGRAFAIASDPSTGQGFLIGGSQARKLKGWRELHEPMLWRWDGTGWKQEPLPQPDADPSTSSWANDVNAAGQAVGAMDVGRDPRRPVFWDSDGTPQVLGPLNGTAQNINEEGSIIVGDYDGRAVYWTRDPDLTWTLHDLPGDCQRAYAVDAFGRIAAARCDRNMSRRYSALFVPVAGGTYEPIFLSGLGDAGSSGEAEAISRWGSYVGGSAPTLTVTLAVVWRVPTVHE